MQYILSEEEYQELKNVPKVELLAQTKKLQKLCTKISDTMPVKTWKNGEIPTPWGCILSVDFEWVCDECPVQEICPNNRKHYSQ